MKKITLSLVAHKLVFSGDFSNTNEVIQEWSFWSSTIDKQSVFNLYNAIMYEKVGWSSCEIEKTEKNVRISLVPIFFVDSIIEVLSDENKEILEGMREQVDKYVEENKSDLINPVFSENKNIKDMQAYILQEPGQSDSLEFQMLLDQLRANGIQFHIEYEHSRADDVGASGGLYEVIVFIRDTVASGIAYDLLKKFPSLIALNIKKDRIDSITEKAASRLNTQVANLELCELEKQESGNISISFNFNRSIHKFEFDSNNDISKYSKIDRGGY